MRNIFWHKILSSLLSLSRSTVMSKKLRVVVVDDSDVQRKIMVKMLQKSSYFDVIAEASGGKSALQMLGLGLVGREKQPTTEIDLIISDCVTPEMTGCEIVKELKKSALCKVPVVMISADSNPARKKECFEAGAFLYLQKPLNPSLIELMKDAVIAGASGGFTGAAGG